MNFDKLFDILMESTAADRHGLVDADSVIDQILPYVDDEDVYIRFDDINKVGINPRQADTFSTPMGIYLYPLKEYWRRFLSEAAHMNKFNPKNPDDVENVKKFKFTGVIPYRVNAKYLMVVKKKSNTVSIDFSDNMTVIEYNNYLKMLKKYKNHKNVSDDEFNGLVEEASEKAYHSDRLNYLWYITMKMSHGNIVEWSYYLNTILRFDLITDKKGLGCIHPSEKIQAVAFKTGYVEHIDTILNKESYVDHNTNSDNGMRQHGFNDIKDSKSIYTKAKFFLKMPSLFLRLSESEQIKLIVIEPKLIEYVEFPSQKMQDVLIERFSPAAVEYIKNLSNISKLEVIEKYNKLFDLMEFGHPMYDDMMIYGIDHMIAYYSKTATDKNAQIEYTCDRFKRLFGAHYNGDIPHKVSEHINKLLNSIK